MNKRMKMNEWINDWMIELMNKGMNKRLIELKHEWISMNE